MSGSSAPQLGVNLLEAAGQIADIEVHLVMSAGARTTIELELGIEPREVEQLADVVWDPSDLGAGISSGSFRTLGMVVVPCSMGTLASIATGTSRNLLTRAADVTMKERRPLILVVRETPLSLIHIRNMEVATMSGATILPPVPAFYHHPETISDLLRHTTGKVFDVLGLDHDLFERWS